MSAQKQEDKGENLEGNNREIELEFLVKGSYWFSTTGILLLVIITLQPLSSALRSWDTAASLTSSQMGQETNFQVSPTYSERKEMQQ